MKKKFKLKYGNFKEEFNKFKAFSFAYLKTNILFMSFLILNLFNATLLRYFTIQDVISLKPFMADLAVVLLIGSIGYFFKPQKQFIYFGVWTIVFTLTCFINSIYYSNYISFASFSLISTSIQLIGVADAVFEQILELKDFIYFIPLLILFVINGVLKKKEYYDLVGKVEIGKLRAMNTAVAGLLVLGFFLSTLTGTNINSLKKRWNREYIVINFGIYVYQINDAIASFKPQISSVFGLDSATKLFKEYYENNQIEKTNNKYTNIYEGKNLLMIHAESIQNFLIGTTINGVEITPNLNKIAKEGMYFSNFYAQESVGTSSDTEFTLNTSLLPVSSGTVFVNYWNREYVSIPKLLKEKNYYSFSMHGNNPTFWNRNNMHPKLGYDKFYAYKDAFELDEIIGLGLSDKSFFRQAVPIISKIKDDYDNFYGTLIMLTNHTPWSDIDSFSDFEVTMEYIDPETKELKISPYLEGTKIGAYIKSVHYADEAIGQLINDLDEAGLLEDTVIGIYGDHDAKLKKADFVTYYNYDPYTDSVKSKDSEDYIDVNYYFYELNRKVPFILWTKNNQKKLEVTEVMGTYDVMPTLGNMFNFYNKYAMGHDIFSVNENVVIFPDTNWLTNKMYYNSQKEDGMPLNIMEPVSKDYMQKYSEIAEQKVSISDKIIVFDLIKKFKQTELEKP